MLQCRFQIIFLFQVAINIRIDIVVSVTCFLMSDIFFDFKYQIYTESFFFFRFFLFLYRKFGDCHITYSFSKHLAIFVLEGYLFMSEMGVYIDQHIFEDVFPHFTR